MALSKSVSSQFGVAAQYHVLTAFTVDRINLVVSLQISGYASEKAERDKQLPLTNKHYTIRFQEAVEAIPPESPILNMEGFIPPQEITPEVVRVFNELSTLGYRLTKLAVDFKDATDC